MWNIGRFIQSYRRRRKTMMRPCSVSLTLGVTHSYNHNVTTIHYFIKKCNKKNRPHQPSHLVEISTSTRWDWTTLTRARSIVGVIVFKIPVGVNNEIAEHLSQPQPVDEKEATIIQPSNETDLL